MGPGGLGGLRIEVDPRVGPVAEGFDRVAEGPALVGERVLDPYALLREHLAADHAGRLQFAQPFGEQAVGQARNDLTDVGEAGPAGEHGAHDRAGPPPADDLDRQVEARTERGEVHVTPYAS